MRNFRTAAVAAATAVTVAFGGVAVASAESSTANESTGSSLSSSSFTQKGKEWGAWTPGEDGKPILNGITPGYQQGEPGYRADQGTGKVLKGPNYMEPNLDAALGLEG